MKGALTAHFITLTYADEHIPLNKSDWGDEFMTLSRAHLVKFNKDLRNANANTLRSIKSKYQLSAKGYKQLKKDYTLKYYAVGEYGTKRNRPHYHSIIFNLHEQVLEKLQFNEIWKYGHVHIGDVNMKTINYCAKYLIDHNKADDEVRVKPFAIISKGIGLRYLAKNRRWHKAKEDHESEHRYYVTLEGHKQRLPRYYKDKIFNQFERKRQGQKALEELQAKQEADIQKYIELYRSKALGVAKYNEDIQTRHDQIRIKSIKTNKL